MLRATHSRRWRGATLGVALIALCGCRAADAQLSRASEAARPHLPVFARYLRWAERTASPSGAWPSPDALRETLFAPLRLQDSVLAAWVERKQRPALQLALPEDVEKPPLPPWVEVRDEGLGTVRVASGDACPNRRGREPSSQRCVWLSHAHAGLRVTLAFRALDQRVN